MLAQMEKRKALEAPLLWFNATETPELLSRAMQSGYTGALMTVDGVDALAPQLPSSAKKVVVVENEAALAPLKLRPDFGELVIASASHEMLGRLALDGVCTALRAFVDDARSLHDAIHVGKQHAYVMMSFKDPTNIPLELVIASLQFSNTLLIKEISSEAMEDALVTQGVMEVGADGVLFTPKTHPQMDQFLGKWAKTTERTLTLSVGKVISARPIGMGYRSCIDLASLFTTTEGMLVGSTSQGGIFCCPEVFFLPYMELRPFRVNAGAVHSYVYNLNNRTDYMTELRAGSPTMIVDAGGKVRRAYVGRVKTEVRPLRLIEVEFENEARVNVMMQDDWHVRIFSDEAKPINITELRPGHKVLGHVAEPGRHVGIKVAEHIVEN